MFKTTRSYLYRYLLIGLSLSFLTLGCSSNTAGDRLLQKAMQYDKSYDFVKAGDNYRAAQQAFIKEGDLSKASRCRLKLQRLEKIMLCFPYTEGELIGLLKVRYPKMPEKDVLALLNRSLVDSITVSGVRHFFYGFLSTILYKNPELLLKDAAINKRNMTIYSLAKKYIYKKKHKAWQPYSDPLTFVAWGKLDIPRKELPAKGLFKVWVPLPVQTASQTGIKILFITPEALVKYPIRTEGEIGQAYFEFPLEELKGNLKLFVKYKFSRYGQDFSMIDLKNIGNYDKDSLLYKRYTRSDKNIEISKYIERKAEEIVGTESNPYFAAKKIYEYIVDNIFYSQVPHLALDAMNFAESFYAFQRNSGDSISQSAYFCALCRAVGIPARACGGWQVMPGISGGQFWAEFYLPNYGWIPVDTVMAQAASCLPQLNDTQVDRFENYYFGGMDPYRLEFQKDLDLALTPPADEPLFLSTVIQIPAAQCISMNDSAGLLTNKYWKFGVKLQK